MGTNPTTSALLQRCSAVATSTWSDALDQLGIAGVIQGLALQSGSGCVAGVALTVKESTGSLNAFPREDFAVGKFIDALCEGTVLIIEMDGAAISSFGGLAAHAARKQGAVGVVINGGCRDIAAIRAAGLWLMSRHVTPISGQRRVKVDAVNMPITVCGVTVNPGDCIIGDETGVVCVSSGRLLDALTIAEDLHARDKHFADALSTGHTFGFTSERLKHM
jgi:3-hexulose-6-phosphate synthase/6-phospho-3-hexuloisomerase